MSKEKNLRKFMDRFFDGGIYLLPPFVREVEGTDADGMKYAGMAINPQDIETAIQKLLASQREEMAEELLSLPRKFWEDEDHIVGGYISKKDLKELLDSLSPNKGGK